MGTRRRRDREVKTEALNTVAYPEKSRLQIYTAVFAYSGGKEYFYHTTKL